MQIARNLEHIHSLSANIPGSTALVPTMGALHAGHLSLIESARRHADRVVVSIFVNPLQFNAADDLTRYPRDEAGDLALLERAGCDLAWLPDIETMYPPESHTTIDLAGLALRWEGAARPGHFRGVATVVAKLFGQIRPNVALFGEKDWQQLQVIRRMVADLHWPVRIQSVPTMRESDGLAMSSRNRFLREAERKQAPLLYQTLLNAAQTLRTGAPCNPVLQQAQKTLRDAGFAWQDQSYIALVDAETLIPIEDHTHGNGRLIAAITLGCVRLLDNIPV